MCRYFFRIGASLAFCASFVFAAEPQPPALRLGNAVQPKQIALDLTLTPGKEAVTGKVGMNLQINQATDVFWLNATDLQVNEAKLTQGGKTLDAKVIPGGDDFVGFQFPSALKPGSANFDVSYKGKVSLRSSEGIFESKNNATPYIFTQFEPISARRAFPCFDEPSFKIPWQLTLHVPQEDSAVANTGVEKETKEADGMKAVRFKETKPLPSYLVAFGVGPFDFVDAGTAGVHHIPVRIVVPHGEAARAKYAASISAEILTREEKYYGIPYPYDKADQLAIPLSFGGAMENPGLVTYDADIILSPPGQDTVRHQRQYASVAAHELAHQWTGDLVTMAWWNDTWLNESFATWMSAKLLAQWKPEWNTLANNQAARLLAINVDTKTSARRITQPIESKGDIGSAFDGITYQKGATVLKMFEHAVGSDTFQHVMHDYLEAHMFGNATAQDFLAVLGRESRPEYAKAFATFLDQTGVPEVKVKLDCGNAEPPKFDLQQQRLLPVGSSGEVNRTWGVPFCVAYADGKERRQECKLLTGNTSELVLPGKGCPTWYLGNDKEVGYYEVQYDKRSLQSLFDHREALSLAEEVGMLGDLNVMARSGKLPWDQVLALAPKLKDDPRPKVLEAAVKLATVPPEYLPQNLKDNYARYVEDTFGKRARELGWMPKRGESDDLRLVQPAFVGFVALHGNDSELVEQAKQLANRWLSDHDSVSSDIARVVLGVAARNGNATFYEKVFAAAKKEHDPYFAPMLISTLGEFRDPQLLQRSLTAALDGTFDMRRSFGILRAAAGDPAVANMPYDYVKQHYAEIVKRLPSGLNTDYAARFPTLASAAGCSATAESDAQAFFEPRMTHVVGGQRALANALEAIHLCSAAKPEAEAQITTFLSGYQGVGQTAKSGMQ